MRPEFTFDRFVSTASSARARRLYEAIENETASTGTWHLLAGPSGTGKTHLLHATAHAFRQSHPDAGITIITAADLVARLVDVCRRDQLGCFHQQFLRYGLLLVDDVHDLLRKPETRTQLFESVRVWAESGTRVVAAGTFYETDQGVQLPSDWAVIDAIALRRPTPEALRLVGKRLADFRHLEVSGDNLDRLLLESAGDVRRLVGGLVRIEAGVLRERPAQRGSHLPVSKGVAGTLSLFV